MAVIEDNASGARVEQGGLRSTLVCRGVGYSTAQVTGTIAAALAINSPIFSMRMSPGAGSTIAFIERIRLQYTTIVAFTTPITAGRRLALYRGSGAACAGGTNVPTAHKKASSSGASWFDTATGGDIRISTTAAQTVVGVTFDTDPVRQLTLTQAGTAGAFVEHVWEFGAADNTPIQLLPGQLLAIRNPTAMDAAGTWQLAISVDWHEAAAL